MEAVLIVLAVFATPVAIIGTVMHYRFKSKQLASGGGDKLLLARCEELEARIQTLETIVCEGDLDAAARMRALPGRATAALPPKT